MKISTRPGVETVVERNGDRVNVKTTQAISGRWLDQLHERAVAHSGRAPLGESQGEWQFCGEFPLNLVLQHIPADAMDDQRAWARFMNSSEYRAFTTGRRF